MVNPEETRPCGGILCDGGKQSCALASLVVNQVLTNLSETPPADPRVLMDEEGFRAFLNRVRKKIPSCRYPQLAEEMLQIAEKKAEEYYKKSKSE